MEKILGGVKGKIICAYKVFGGKKICIFSFVSCFLNFQISSKDYRQNFFIFSSLFILFPLLLVVVSDFVFLLYIVNSINYSLVCTAAKTILVYLLNPLRLYLPHVQHLPSRTTPFCPYSRDFPTYIPSLQP